MRRNYLKLYAVSLFFIIKKMMSKRNRMKSSWEFMSVELVHFRLREEVVELHDEIHPPAGTGYMDPEKAMYEFCDVAAFAMIGILQCWKEIVLKRKRERLRK